MGGLWQVAQFDQCWVKVDQAHWLPAGLAGLDFRAGDKHRHARGFLPQRAFGPMLFFAQVKAVITPQND